MLVAAAHLLISVVDASGGKVADLEGNEGRAAELWKKMPRGCTRLSGTVKDEV